MWSWRLEKTGTLERPEFLGACLPDLVLLSGGEEMTIDGRYDVYGLVQVAVFL